MKKATLRRIGTVSVDGINEKECSCEISYMIAEPDFQKRGLATEAVSSIIRQMAGEGITKFYATVCGENIASVKTVEKLGFVKLGTEMNFDIYKYTAKE